MVTRKSNRFPLSPKAQGMFVRLGATRYWLTWRFNGEAGCWMLGISDATKKPIIDNIPVVTGLDLLAPYRHLGIAGSILAQTAHDTDAVPTFGNLGAGGEVYYITTSP
jgi:hypothetical protein